MSSHWRCRDRIIETAGRTLIMGILNVTPDSFSDGGSYKDTDAAVTAACRMVDDGADIIDIGGESTRPGSQPPNPQQEWQRVGPVLRVLRAKLPQTFLSIDTYKPEVAQRALEAGADIINDIYALRYSDQMAPVIAAQKAGLIIMHMLGTPADMQKDPVYGNVTVEVKEFLHARLRGAVSDGIPEECIVIDPGIGFGKTCNHNVELIAGLEYLRLVQRPILVGVSRKAFLGKLTGDLPVDSREEATIAACCAAVMNGASIVRVHNVAGARRAMQVLDAIRSRI